MASFKMCRGIAAALLVSILVVGCPTVKDAISLSNTSYDFGLNGQPWNLEVWDSDATVTSLTVTAAPDQSWIHCDPVSVTSTGSNDVKIVTISVNRLGLAQGAHTGTIQFTAPGAKTKKVAISMTSDGTSGVEKNGIKVSHVSKSYSMPYLLDFTFSLRDKDDRPVVGEPKQFAVTCFEDGIATSPQENAPLLAKASNKQLDCFLVLDYSASMASTRANGDTNQDGKSDAIEAMESAVSTVFLPSLSSDAMVGVYEFHRETDPEKIVGLTADKDFVRQRIAVIWSQVVAGLAGPSRAWDAVGAAVDEFTSANISDENRNIVFLSDGHDTSSFRTKEQVIDDAKKRGVRLYCVGFGPDVDVATLQAITAQTNGAYYGAPTAADLETAFQRIVEEFDGQYALRWATLKRTDSKFVPSFLITLAGNEAHYVSATPYVISSYADDELTGHLRIAPSKNDNRSTLFLRASYMCRYIWKIRLYAESPYPFTASKVEAVDGGLCADWTLTTGVDAQRPGTWISLESPQVGTIDATIPFAAFGPILRFEFERSFDEDETPFTVLHVDNGLYGGGQALEIEGFSNVLPAV